MLPLAYAAHGLWLFFALQALGLQMQPSGTVLPMKFKAVLYLDVFGWLSRQKKGRQCERASQQRPTAPKTAYFDRLTYRSEGDYETLAEEDGRDAAPSVRDASV